VGRSVFDREAFGPAVEADAPLLRLRRGSPRLSLRPVNDYAGNSGQREHRSSNEFHGGDLRTAPNVAQLFAESCNGHHKKSVSRTMMSIRLETSTHTPSGAAQIRVSGLAKRYGALQVFRGIEFNVGEREIVAIVGPSGCGKTTLLRCIDGLIAVDAGEIVINAERVASPVPGVAMVFQHFGLFPWKTVYDNVAYGLRMARVAKVEIARRVPLFINLVGLTGFEHAYPYQMSGGMQQRCGLARALAVEPSVLLMDEPFAAVDAQTREILQFELLRIWESRPTTMVFVTHSIEEAVLMGDRVLVLKGRPSHIDEVVDIDLPRPRNRDTLRLPRFGELRERVWGTLMSEARQAEFQLDK